MNKRIIIMCTAVAALAMSPLFVGCERTVSKSETTKVDDDGTVKSKEKTVTQNPDGTVTRTEETKKTEPIKP